MIRTRKAITGKFVAGAPTSQFRCPEVGNEMSTVAKLLARKQALMERLESDPGPNEREEMQALLAQIETALNLLDPRDAAGPSDQ